jgi:hypothetical protein
MAQESMTLNVLIHSSILGMAKRREGNLILLNGTKYKMDFSSPNTAQFTNLETGVKSLLKKVR